MKLKGKQKEDMRLEPEAQEGRGRGGVMNARPRGGGGVPALASYWQESEHHSRVRKRYERQGERV